MFDAIQARWPDDDLADSRERAISGAMMIAFGDATLDELGANLARARRAEREAMETLTGAVLSSATRARSPRPGSEGDLIERSGLSRGKVREILGDR